MWEIHSMSKKVTHLSKNVSHLSKNFEFQSKLNFELVLLNFELVITLPIKVSLYPLWMHTRSFCCTAVLKLMLSLTAVPVIN